MKSDDAKNSKLKNNQPPNQKELFNIRHSISSLDDQLLSILFERRQLSRAVAKEKQFIDKPLRDQAREQQLLESLIDKASNSGLDPHYVTRLFNTIIEDSVQFQQNYLQSLNPSDAKNNGSKTLAVLGGKGAYSYLAAKKYFANSDNQYLACSSFDKVIKSVQQGEADFGVIPIENTTSGGITEVYDLLLGSDLTIIGEEKYAVKHCLIGKPNSDMNDITVIAAHPEANKQCSKNLKKQTSAKINLLQSTAHALQMVVDAEQPNIAAIASEEAAKLFNLKVLMSNITNQTENITRFLVLSKKTIKVPLAVQCKTSIAISTGQQPGALAEVLMLFKEAEVPLSRLESRPIADRPWEQMFHIDLVGNIEQPHLSKALDELPKLCSFIRIFGCYPTKDLTATKVSPQSLAKAKINLMAHPNQHFNPENGPTGGEINASLLYSDRYHFIHRHYKQEDSIIEMMGVQVGGDNFSVFAGPATIESDQQIFSCAKHAAETGVSVLSAYCSQDNGLNLTSDPSIQSKLDTMRQVSKKFLLPMMIKVSNPSEVNQLAEQADILLVAPQDIHNIELMLALGKINRAVILQRGLLTSLSEFLAAAEFILKQGNMQVILCENGQYSIDPLTPATLDLGALALLKASTHLPVIISPAKAVIDKTLIAQLTRAAKAIGVNGLLVEFDLGNNQANNTKHKSFDFSQMAELMKNIYH